MAVNLNPKNATITVQTNDFITYLGKGASIEIGLIDMLGIQVS